VGAYLMLRFSSKIKIRSRWFYAESNSNSLPQPVIIFAKVSMELTEVLS
jgi:hypothetical protein